MSKLVFLILGSSFYRWLRFGVKVRVRLQLGLGARSRSCMFSF